MLSRPSIGVGHLGHYGGSPSSTSTFSTFPKNSRPRASIRASTSAWQFGSRKRAARRKSRQWAARSEQGTPHLVLMSQSAISMCASISSGVASCCRRGEIVMSREESVSFLVQSSKASTSGKAITLRPANTDRRSGFN